MHVRQSIINATIIAVTGLTTTGLNIFASRIRPIADNKLPCLLVYDTEETIDFDRGSLDSPARDLVVRISGVVEANTNLDETMNTIAEEVEVAMGADITLGGYSISTDLTGTSKELNNEAEKQVGIVNLDYLINYRTPFGDPSTVA